jgi:hypothetical protein
VGHYFDDDPPPKREKPSGDMAGAAFGDTTAAARIRLEARNRRLDAIAGRPHGRRDLMIYLGHSVGLSNRWMAGAFGLARSRIDQIVARLEDELGPLVLETERVPARPNNGPTD